MLHIPSKYLKSIDYLGLKGRLLHLPPPKNKSKRILLISGQHTSIERMYGISQFLNNYGEVFNPDLPGFGGMEALYRIDIRPTHEQYARYLYFFMKKNRLTANIWVVANSLGFQYFTLMLIIYPDSRKWIEKPIGLVAFADGANFCMPWVKKYTILGISYLARTQIGDIFFRKIILGRFGLNVMLNLFSKFKAKMKSDRYKKADIIGMEKHLWRDNDSRTHAFTAIEMMKYELSSQAKELIPMQMTNIITHSDQYFDNHKVELSFKKIFADYRTFTLTLPAHAPSIIGDRKSVEQMMPEGLKEMLCGSIKRQ